MGKRCMSCIYRADDCSGLRGGCIYILATGKSRLKEAYEATGDKHLTKKVKRALNSNKCRHYIKGPRVQVEEERQISLPGSRARRKQIDNAKARELHATGLTDSEIGKRLGVQTKTIRQWRMRNKLQSNYSPRKPWKLTEEEALQRHREGWSDSRLARELGVSAQTVGRWRKQNGLPVNYGRGRDADL